MIAQSESPHNSSPGTVCSEGGGHLQADGQGGVRTAHVLLRAPAAGWPAALALRCALHLAPHARREPIMHIAVNACALGCAHVWCDGGGGATYGAEL